MKESQLDKAERDQLNALRNLARVLGRATLASEDEPEYVADLLMRAGFTEWNDEDVALLNAIDPSGPLSEAGPGVCRGCGGNFSHALKDGKCDECLAREADEGSES